MRSLETRWLKLEKWITVPEIVVLPNHKDQEYQACFYWPEDNRLLVEDGCDYDMRDGLIIIHATSLDDELPECIAHEMRHVWQYYRGWRYDGNTKISFSDETKKKQNIIQYFTTSISEMDALQYSLLKAPSQSACEWYEWIIRHQENNHYLR